MTADAPDAGPELDALIAERLFGRTGIGYYGPPADPAEEWLHEKSVRYDTEEEAIAADRRYYDACYPDEESRRGRPTPEEMGAMLCYWEDGWGPLAIDEYSTSGDGMLLVVERMRELGYTVLLVHRTDGSLRRDSYEFDCSFTDWNTPPYADYYAKAPTAPLAVARAALRAMEQTHVQ